MRKRWSVKLATGICLGLTAGLMLSACAGEEVVGTGESPATEEVMSSEITATRDSSIPVLAVNGSETYQTWRGFGTSSCWWSQYVGSWDKPYGDGTVPVREQIAKWLYSRDEGIGLTIYRYNVGAGSADSQKGTFWDNNRRAHSFIGVDGEYNWNKDKNAVWFMKYCVDLGGIKDVVFFCNSPLEKLTRNGLAHMTEGGENDNLAPENYEAFADYVFDVAEHFRAEGIPVTDISPINEPQWDWFNGQEGCHYEPAQMAEVLKVFVEEVDERGLGDELRISTPESGEWGGRTREYVKAILDDEELGAYFKTLDIHSYWSNAEAKTKFKSWVDDKYPGTELIMSEWCEMVNGKDYTMDSAYNMADVIWEDMTILDVTSWQYWVGVADGDYRDGLIYVNKDKKAARPNRRLWGYGNYTKFIRPGYVRLGTSSESKELTALRAVAFTGEDDLDGKQRMAVVLINRGEARQFYLDGVDAYTSYKIYTTSEERDLEETASGSVAGDTVFSIEGESIVTIVLE
jgi:O-glycosyl hydrolase